jgi:HTH-type transcriptional regulator / antitoxin HigA
MLTNFSKLRPHILLGPGDHIEEQLDVRGWTQEDFADIIGVSIQTVNKLIKNKTQITASIAVSLAEAFDQTPQYWLNLNTLYQLQLTDYSAKGKEIQLRKEIYQRMPINEMAKRGWIHKGKSFQELEQAILQFWNWAQLDFSQLDKQMRPAFKKSDAFAKNFSPHFALCWFQMAKNVAAQMVAPDYDKAALERLYHQIPHYSVRENGVAAFLEALQAVGVNFFILGHLKETHIDGAAFMAQQNPVIVYTARHKRLDNFWFTLAHEIAHILLHVTATSFWFIDIESNETNQLEIEANELAQKVLKHPEIMAFFAGKTDYLQTPQIRACAQTLEIHPCLVIGALTHTRKLHHSRLHEFNEDFMPKIPELFLPEKKFQVKI